MNDIAIELKNVSKKYKLYKAKSDRLKEALHPLNKKYHRDFFALKDINLSIQRGDIVGIVGRNGSGKSTLLKIISGVLTPNEGEVSVKGKIVALLELGAGLNPEFTGVENIYFYGSILGFSRQEMEQKFADIVAFSELGDFIYQPLKNYSSGMRARLGFAVSVFVNPDILILDEVLSVGDELFRRKCYAKMEEFFKGGKTILYVSHSAQSINELCTKAILIDKGKYILNGPPKLVTVYYQKMLYARPEDEPSIMSEIEKMNSDEHFKNEIYRQMSGRLTSKNEHGTKEGLEKSNAEGKKKESIVRYLAALKPKSTIHIMPHNITISNVSLKSDDQELVNILRFKNYYYVSYDAQFNVAADNVSFCMAIYNNKGVMISTIGGVSFRRDKGRNVKIGEIYKASWKFKNILTPGLYFINVQISGDVDGVHKVLSGITDAYAFKVEDSEDISVGGMVDLEQSSYVEKI